MFNFKLLWLAHEKILFLDETKKLEISPESRYSSTPVTTFHLKFYRLYSQSKTWIDLRSSANSPVFYLGQQTWHSWTKNKDQSARMSVTTFLDDESHNIDSSPIFRRHSTNQIYGQSRIQGGPRQLRRSPAFENLQMEILAESEHAHLIFETFDSTRYVDNRSRSLGGDAQSSSSKSSPSSPLCRSSPSAGLIWNINSSSNYHLHFFSW